MAGIQSIKKFLQIIFLAGLVPLVFTGATAMASANFLETVHSGNLQKVKQMLQQGADVEARSSKASTPLIVAASDGRHQIVKALLDAGADVNAVNQYGKIRRCYWRQRAVII